MLTLFFSSGLQENAIRRLNLGGKILTNLLKEAVTYRQWNMMDEYHIVNDCKEQVSVFAQEYSKNLLSTIVNS